MSIVVRLGVVAVAGAVLATAASLANGVAALLGEVGTPRAERSGLAQVGEFFTLVLDSGWGWAVAAVIMGWWATRRLTASGTASPSSASPSPTNPSPASPGPANPSPANHAPTALHPTGLRALGLGAVAGSIGLTAAALLYSPTEALFAGGSTEWGPIQTFWLLAGVVLGLPLGAIGAAIHRPGPVGAVAALVAPAGAALSQVLFPPPASTAGSLVRWLVWIVAVALAATLVARALRRQDSAQTPSSLPLGSVK